MMYFWFYTVFVCVAMCQGDACVYCSFQMFIDIAICFRLSERFKNTR